MKAIITGLFLSIISLQAFAVGLEDFAGKYTIGKCSGEVRRAYVTIARDKNKNEVGLDIWYFGAESEILTLLLGVERLPNPNFKLGNNIKEMISQGMLSEDTLTVATTYVYGDDTEELIQVITVKKTAKGLIVESVGEEAGSCDFIFDKK
ncbi:MAG: hypothetical protein K2Q18_16255 [Bdellovibrionales bacterium]|nr:hypothetical protein [Bdellovibrionales bacterium]